MDLFETIRADHETILGLIDAIETANPGDIVRQNQLRDQLVALMMAHTQAEEQLLYPILQNDDDGRPVMVMAEEQHHVMTLLLVELRNLSAANEHFLAKCAVLAENLEDHLDEEEDDIFPLVADLIDDDESRRLAVRFQQMVQANLSRQRRAA